MDRKDFAISAALFVAAIAYFAQFVSFGISLADEGALIAQFERLGRGQVPYVDFHVGYTPGVYYLHAWVMRIYGFSMIPGRWLLASVHASSLVLLYLLARSATRSRGFACCAALFYVSVMLVHPGAFAASNIPYPVWYNVPIWVLGLLCMLRFADTRRVGWLSIAGLVAGLDFLFKPNVGLFHLSAVSLLALSLIPVRGSRRWEIRRVLPWFGWWGGILAGLGLIFAGAGVQELLLFLLPALAAAGLVLRSALAISPETDEFDGAPGVVSAAVRLGGGFLLVNLPWLVYFSVLLGPQRFLRRALFFGAHFESFYFISHPPIFIPVLGMFVLAAVVLLLLRWGMRRGLLVPPAAVPTALVLLGAALYLFLSRGPASEGLYQIMTSRFERRFAFALIQIVQWTGLWLWLKSIRSGTSDPAGTFRNAVLCTGGIFLYLQIYPRTDFMHWVTAAPVSVVLGFVLLRRGAATWSARLSSPFQARVAAAGMALPLAALIALRLNASLEIIRPPDGLEDAPRAVMENDKAPIWNNAGAAGHFSDLSALARFLRENTGEDERIFTFPSLDVISYLAGRPNATRHAYFFPGWPGHDVEAEVIAALTAHPPRFAVVLHRHILFFRDAAIYYRALGDYLEDSYRFHARFGRYVVLSHRETGPSGDGPVHRSQSVSEVLGPALDARLQRDLGSEDVAVRLAAVESLTGLFIETPYPPLSDRLADPDARVRNAAAAALARSRDPKAALALVEEIASGVFSTSHGVVAMRSMRNAMDRRCVRALLFTARSQQPGLAVASRRLLDAIASDELWSSFWPSQSRRLPSSLSDMGLGPAAAKRILRWLGDSEADPRLRRFAAWASYALPDDDVFPLLRKIIFDEEVKRSKVRLHALWAMVQRGRADEILVPASELFQFDDLLAPRVFGAAVEASRSGDQTLAQLIRVAPPRVVARAAWLAASVGGPRSVSALEVAVDGPRHQRIPALWALGQIGTRSHGAVLERATHDPDVDVREMAGLALEMLERRHGRGDTAH